MYKKIITNWIKYINIKILSNLKKDIEHINSRAYFNFKELTSHESNGGLTLKFDNKDRLIPFLKERFPAPKKQYEEDKNKLFLFFPLVQVMEKRKIFIIPLFAIDITSQKDNLFRDKRLFLKVYEKVNYSLFKVVLSHFFRINEDILAENIPLFELIKIITGRNFTTFITAMETLKMKIKKDVGENSLFHNDCLIWSDQNNYFFDLKMKKELSLLKDLNFIDSSLLSDYLTISNQALSATYSKYRWFGSLSSEHPPTQGQCLALSKLNEGGERIIPVQGAPGTGKTTLLFSVMASRIVDRAFSLAKYNNDKNNLMFIVSTSNKAVENITNQFSHKDKFSNINFLYFLGGKKEKFLKSSIRVKKFIKQLKDGKYNKNKYNKIKYKVIDKYEKLSKLSKNMTDKGTEIQNCKKKITKFAEEKKISEESLGSWILSEIEHCIFEARQLNFHDHKLELKNILEWLESKQENLQKLYRKLKHKYQRCNLDSFSKNIGNFNDAFLDFEKVCSAIKKVPFFQFEFLFGKREKFLKEWESKYTNLIGAIDLRYSSNIKLSYLSKIRHIFNSINKDIRKLDINPIDINKVDKLLLEVKNIKSIKHFFDLHINLSKELEVYNYSSFDECYRLNTINDQKELYSFCLKFITLEMLKRKDKLISVLYDWIDIFSYDGTRPRTIVKRWKEEGIREKFELLSLAYPIMTSTISSADKFWENFLYSFTKNSGLKIAYNPFEDFKPIDLLMSDESGMMLVHSIAPLLYKSNNALIIGDNYQIEPISDGLSDEDILNDQENYENTREYEFYSPSNMISAYDMSVDHNLDTNKAVCLDEHRRCQLDIANLFISLVPGYSNIKVKTKPIQKKIGTNLIFYDVDGKEDKQENTNIDEVNSIRKILNSLKKDFSLTKDIGIVTPYRNQAELLIKNFKNDLEHTDIFPKIGTIHKFQGSEFNVIIFSPVLFLNTHSSSFFNSKPNIFNVAISRAKELFIICGNYRYFQSIAGYAEKISNYISRYGQLYDGTPDDDDDRARLKETFKSRICLGTCDSLEYFDNALKTAKKEIIIISPWLGYYISAFNRVFSNIVEAFKRNIQIIIFYGWKDGENQEYFINRYENLLGKEYVINVPNKTHEKCMICDRKEITIGSLNWLSNNYYKHCNSNQSKYLNGIRREISVIMDDVTIINEILNSLQKDCHTKLRPLHKERHVTKQLIR